MTKAAASVPEQSFESFEAAWDQFFGSVRRARGRAAREHGDELTLSQQHLLAALADEPELPVGQIALAAGVSPPTATRMLDHLERTGVVTREQSSEDRRVVTVTLTREGRHLLARKREAIAAKRLAVFDSLTEAERDQAGRLLGRLAGVIDEL